VEKTSSLYSPEIQLLIKKYSPYLVEFRKRVVFTLFFFASATFIGFAFYENLVRFLISALNLQTINIVFTSPFQFINLAISCGVATGLILSFPLLLVQLLTFLRPALKYVEYRLIILSIPFSLLLFLVGFIFGAFVMKWQIEIFLDKSVSLGIGNILDISRLLETVVYTSALIGLGFQFPILIIILLRLGIVERQQLARARRWIYLLSFLFSMLLPADSIIVDLLISLPLILLFESTLIVDRLLSKKK
jgi:sec-independent protein translocase protein TatC